MDVDHGLASIELVHHRRKCRVAEPFVGIARDQADAVGAQHVEGEFDLAQAAVDVGERQGGEHSEATAMIGGEAGRIFIAASRKPAGGLIVAEPHARVTDRGDRRRDAGAIHILDRARGRPVDQRLLPGLQPFDRGAEFGWGMMMVDVYSV